eukprot:scaffold26716_cov96-Isochrysis_galbana.AAC.3
MEQHGRRSVGDRKVARKGTTRAGSSFTEKSMKKATRSTNRSGRDECPEGLKRPGVPPVGGPFHWAAEQKGLRCTGRWCAVGDLVGHVKNRSPMKCVAAQYGERYSVSDPTA